MHGFAIIRRLIANLSTSMHFSYANLRFLRRNFTDGLASCFIRQGSCIEVIYPVRQRPNLYSRSER